MRCGRSCSCAVCLLWTPGSPWSLFRLAPWQDGAGQTAIAVIDLPMVAPVPRPIERRSGEAAPSTPPASMPLVPAARSPVISPPSDASMAEVTAESPSLSFAVPGTRTAGTESQRPVVSARRSLGEWLAGAWLVGCVLCGGYVLLSLISLRRQIKRCRPVRDGAVLDLLESARHDVGLWRGAKLLVTADPISPCVVGAWRTCLIVPELALTELSPAALRQVFVHELAHVSRGDLWTNWLLLAARTLHWFNPFVWWTVSEMQAARGIGLRRAHAHGARCRRAVRLRRHGLESGRIAFAISTSSRHGRVVFVAAAVDASHRANLARSGAQCACAGRRHRAAGGAGFGGAGPMPCRFRPTSQKPRHLEPMRPRPPCPRIRRRPPATPPSKGRGASRDGRLRPARFDE